MRLEGWEQRLNRCIDHARSRPFQWGAHDCCLFAADAVYALTGLDPALAFRGKYSTANEAALLLYDLGGIESLPSAVGLAEIPTSLAGRGDVVLAENGGRILLGVLDGSGLKLAVPGAVGLLFLPKSAALKAWRV